MRNVQVNCQHEQNLISRGFFKHRNTQTWADAIKSHATQQGVQHQMSLLLNLSNSHIVYHVSIKEKTSLNFCILMQRKLYKCTEIVKTFICLCSSHNLIVYEPMNGEFNLYSCCTCLMSNWVSAVGTPSNGFIISVWLCLA